MTAADDSTGFKEELSVSLETGKGEIARTTNQESNLRWVDGLGTARDLMLQLEPVPQIIWRVSNYILGRNGSSNMIPEGFLFGLKRPVMNMAKDRVLGNGEGVATVALALKEVPHDVMAAGLILYAVCRKLQRRSYQAVWGPILEDAVLRAHLGFYVGTMQGDFGAGRGMLAGFSSRVGLALLIATGTDEQADRVLIELAQETPDTEISCSVFDVDHLQVAAMMLIAAGCGRDAGCGVSSCSVGLNVLPQLSRSQRFWMCSTFITGLARIGRLDAVPDAVWTEMGYDSIEERDELKEIVRTLIRRGHGWNWLL